MGSLIGKYMCSLGNIPIDITKREYSLGTKKTCVSQLCLPYLTEDPRDF